MRATFVHDVHTATPSLATERVHTPRWLMSTRNSAPVASHSVLWGTSVTTTDGVVRSCPPRGEP
jgi:hypothetical protein